MDPVGVTFEVDMVEGDGWLKVHVLPSATIAQRDLFDRIEAYAVEQFAAHYDTLNHITMPDVKGD